MSSRLRRCRLSPSPLVGPKAGEIRGSPRKTEQSSGEGFLHEFNHFQKKPRQLIQHPQTSFILTRSLSCGNCFRSRSKWGEDRRLRWRVTDPLSGEVASKGSPAGTRTGACWTSTLRGEGSDGYPHGITRFAEPPKRNGRAQKSPDGRSSDRILLLPRRASTIARLSHHSMARRKKRTWQGQALFFDNQNGISTLGQISRDSLR